MKKFNQLIVLLAMILFMLPIFTTQGQSGTQYNMRVMNAAQVSCNVYEFDVFISSTTSNLVRMANFQIGMLVNPAIIPPGAIMEASIVPGSSTMPDGMKPGSEKFYYDNDRNSFQVAPNTPIGIGSTVNNVPQGTGWKMFRARIACNQPFVVGQSTNHEWNFNLNVAYPTRVFAYLSGFNNEITVPSYHTLSVNPNITTAGGYPDPIAQTVSTDMTAFCNLPGSGATISLGSTQLGYTYYLYSDGIRVQGQGGIIYGNGSGQSFGAKASGSVMSVMSVGCTGLIPMANTVSLSPAPPVPVTLSLTAIPGTIILPGTPVMFTANSTNEGISPFYGWFVNGDQDWTAFDSEFEYFPMHGDQVQVVLYPSLEVCTQNTEVFSNVLTIYINEVFNVTGGGTICETSYSFIHLSGSKTGILYTLLKDGVPYGAPTPGTGQPLWWLGFDAGVYTVEASGLPMTGSAVVLMNPLPETPGQISGPAYVPQGTLNVSYTVPLVNHADTLLWDYTGTGVTITASGMYSVTLDFASNATSGTLWARGFNDNCGYGELSYYPIGVCQHYTTELQQAICSNQLPYEWETYTGANAITGPGIYTVVYPTTNPPGCDSTITLTLTVNPTEYYLTEASVCAGSTYTWMGNDYTLAGTYYSYGQTQNGCQITYELQLTVDPRPEAKISLNGVELPPVINAVTDMCVDNSLILTLTGMPYGTPPLTFNYTLNNVAQTVTVGIGDHLFSELPPLTPGTYAIVMTSITDAKGCSVHPMVLPYYNHTFIVHPNEYYLTEAEICEGEVYTWMGTDYDSPGSYYAVGENQYGCLVNYELQLTVHPAYFYTETVSVYNIELPYVWQGNSYNAAGTYYANYQTVNGCDSIYELVLLVKSYIPLSITKNIGTAVQAEWYAIPGATMYQLRYRTTTPQGSWVYVTQSTQMIRKIVPLQPGTEYELQIRHREGLVWYPWASVFAPYIFTTNVVTFTSTNDIGNKFMLHWTELDDVSSYILQYRKSPSTTWITRGYYPGNQAVLGSMEEGTLYEYRVCPRYNEVSFDWTQSGGVTSNYINITVSNYTGTSASFSWDALVNPVPSNYYLQVRPSAIPNSFYTTTNSVTANGFEATANEYRLVVWYNSLSWGATGWRPLTGSKQEEAKLLPHDVLSVYPNPVSDELTVEILSTEGSVNTWNLYDVNGKLVMSGSESLTAGPNYFYIDMTQLPSGLYMLQSSFNGTVESTRIMKQ